MLRGRTWVVLGLLATGCEQPKPEVVSPNLETTLQQPAVAKFARAHECAEGATHSVVRERTPASAVVGVVGCGTLEVIECRCPAKNPQCSSEAVCETDCEMSIQDYLADLNPTAPASVPVPDAMTAQELWLAARRAYDNEQYIEAARRWDRTLDLLEREGSPLAERQSTWVLAMEAYRAAADPQHDGVTPPLDEVVSVYARFSATATDPDVLEDARRSLHGVLAARGACGP